MQNGPSGRVVLPPYFGADLQSNFLALVSFQNSVDQWNLSFVVIGGQGDPVVSQSFVMFLVFGLSPGNLIDEVDEVVSFFAGPDLRGEGIGW